MIGSATPSATGIFTGEGSGCCLYDQRMYDGSYRLRKHAGEVGDSFPGSDTFKPTFAAQDIL